MGFKSMKRISAVKTTLKSGNLLAGRSCLKKCCPVSVESTSGSSRRCNGLVPVMVILCGKCKSCSGCPASLQGFSMLLRRMCQSFCGEFEMKLRCCMCKPRHILGQHLLEHHRTAKRGLLKIPLNRGAFQYQSMERQHLNDLDFSIS